ncbi:MAG: 16S rRNA (adenine(1518)-N(6)/adenine(1519)-N(6))-dimethyltransferase RsmA [Chloroflexota bacterium]|nr:16S rRNA (adenine(1518)-N(6)/adenine(1519)-N(6))-dimethyltransferase RsmA [Chloroflexota bacterium]
MTAHNDGVAPHAALRQHGLKPRKNLGQNFLRDRSYLERILAAGEIGSCDTVLEIGAGTGVLTHALAAQARGVVAVELDDSLVGLLLAEFESVRNVEIWHGSALDFDPCCQLREGYKLVGNIPYYITGPIIRRYLEASCPPRCLVLMVQHEVAERIVAPPGSLSLLGVSVQFYASAEIVARVPSRAFFPRPKVDSAILRLSPHSSTITGPLRDAFFAVARAGFGMRRKQLVNSLSSGLSLSRDSGQDLLARAGIDEKRRAETLSIAEWTELARYWRDGQGMGEA